MGPGFGGGLENGRLARRVQNTTNYSALLPAPRRVVHGRFSPPDCATRLRRAQATLRELVELQEFELVFHANRSTLMKTHEFFMI